MTTIMGIDPDRIPTADLMELAATLMQIDGQAIEGLRECLRMIGADVPAQPSADVQRTIVALLKERAVAVRTLEMRVAGRLDS